jgi:hypothetical protein
MVDSGRWITSFIFVASRSVVEGTLSFHIGTPMSARIELQPRPDFGLTEALRRTTMGNDQCVHRALLRTICPCAVFIRGITRLPFVVDFAVTGIARFA